MRTCEHANNLDVSVRVFIKGATHGLMLNAVERARRLWPGQSLRKMAMKGDRLVADTTICRAKIVIY